MEVSRVAEDNGIGRFQSVSGCMVVVTWLWQAPRHGGVGGVFMLIENDLWLIPVTPPQSAKSGVLVPGEFKIGHRCTRHVVLS